ncbi:MAG: hypothetical protein D6788_04370 [Planctomycetota bacterium]|nr:MAG: hypothetical protein D6788_04370 [Planctomycetota bacterium]
MEQAEEPRAGEDCDPAACRWRLGVVSYLNAKPLIEGLELDPRITMVHDVPSRLADRLEQGEVDAALVPVIDLVRGGRRWRIVSDACIGCDGETLTVRVLSRVPPESIRRLHVDGDSHTSVVLASVLWRELYGRRLELLPFRGNETVEACEAVLLIGDKVVRHGLIGYDLETDLGSAWKHLTSLPFVFAVWAAPVEQDTAELGAILSRARDRGVKSAAMIAEDLAPGLGWPTTLAKRYLCTRIKYHLGPRQRQGMERFLALAEKHDLVDAGERLVFA